ncbi:MAG: formate C-acetyltransferase [Francisellaceae bacterium]
MNEITTFHAGRWVDEIDVRDFIQKNIVPYEGDHHFLQPATEATKKLWQMLMALRKQEIENGILDAETVVPSDLTSHRPGYIDQSLEKIVGLQTDKPLKRGIMPKGGIRLVKKALESYGYALDPVTETIFSKYRKTHNEGVFDVYTPEMLAARKAGIITGLPDAYGRGRIIGDYRRVALYGVDRLLKEKHAEQTSSNNKEMSEVIIRQREEIAEQIKALSDLKTMALEAGFDISKPAQNAQEAIQWLYFGYLAATKEADGAATSLGRVSSFIDIYLENDINKGRLTELQAQELVDHFIMKLRIIRFLRPEEYNQLFSGDPTWVTEAIGGMSEDGRTLVTKTSFRFLHTLYNLGAAPEPNLTVLWSDRLPETFKRYCAQVSKDTSAVQYENDELMRPKFGDDYAIACCVSAMRIGKQMQFFGARANLAKALLYAINGGVDEKSGIQVAPKMVKIEDDYLDFEKVFANFEVITTWLARLYVNTLNVIHYMHDKYNYERILMALHDKDIYRTMACGIAGLSVAADSLSAIKYARVKPIRNEAGLAVDFAIEGEFPKYGNNDDRVDSIAKELVDRFMDKLRQNPTYRDATPTQSVLTITSNVVYGKKTGSTPDGRKSGEPFAPGANPMHGRDTHGAIASLASVAKISYDSAEDGISNTFTIVPKALGKSESEQVNNLASLLDAYFTDGGHHLNVNVLQRDMLLHAMEHPEEYPQLTIRVSGYAVNFVKLTREQQQDVINRTFHQHI